MDRDTGESELKEGRLYTESMGLWEMDRQTGRRLGEEAGRAELSGRTSHSVLKSMDLATEMAGKPAKVLQSLWGETWASEGSRGGKQRGRGWTGGW